MFDSLYGCVFFFFSLMQIKERSGKGHLSWVRGDLLYCP